MNENFCILIQISLKFAPKCLIHNEAALVQVMVYCLFGTKSLPDPVLTQFTDAYIQH